MKKTLALALLGGLGLTACAPAGDATDEATPVATAMSQQDVADYWNSATIYFLLTDRFRNGDASNDNAKNRPLENSATLRGFEGGDLAGVLEKIEDGYFEALGVDAIWMTPFVEQIDGGTDEGTGTSYGFHGYWT